MARIRSIKPEFFLNDQLAPLPFQWRLLFIGLWTQADRNGRLEDRPLKLKAALFPNDDLDVNDGLCCLANEKLITRYERDGVRYVAIPTWSKHQQPHVREKDGIIPPPDGPMSAPCQHRASTPDQGADQDQGREEEHTPPARGAAGDVSAIETRFQRFWAAYPRKVGVGAARKVFTRLRPDDELTAVMIAAVEAQAHTPQWRKDGGQFIPHARTWLSQERWKDNTEPAAQITRSPVVDADMEKFRLQREQREAYRLDLCRRLYAALPSAERRSMEAKAEQDLRSRFRLLSITPDNVRNAVVLEISQQHRHRTIDEFAALVADFERKAS